MAENLGSKIGSAFIEVGASFIGFGQNLAADVTNAVLAQSFVVGQALENFGQAVFTKFSLPLLAATGANIAQFQALDREIRTVLTLFGTAPSLVEDTFGEMSAGVRDVAIEVGGLERDISDGLYQAISAGVPRGGVFEFMSVAQMAAIADKTADVTTAVDGLTTVVNAFSLESEDAARIADVMFATVAAGKTTFGELSADIGRVAPLAAGAGVEFEEMFSILGTLTLGGLQTSESISFLRAAITGLLRPTEELNTVFADAGFASAEAAIPVIGLQEAFSLVFDAVGGSTSKMQELIGTSEGVSAILGITGDNADRFSGVMAGVENSTGSTSRAFEIMDESVGRTFGKLTEAFDRLGNTFGEMASQFAVPVVEAATDVLNRMVEIFSNFRPIVSGLAQGFGKFIQLLQAPILKEIVAIFAVLGTTIFGTIGALGLFALTLGKVLLAGIQIKAVASVFRGLNVILTVSRHAIMGMGASMVTAAGQMRQGGTAARVAARPVGLLGTAFKSTRFASLAAGGAFLGISVAIAGIIAGIGHLINEQKKYIESQDIFGKQTDKLTESLGLLNQEMTLPGAEEGQSSMAAFLEENLALVNLIKDTKDSLGELAAVDLIEAIAVKLVFQGNSPEEVLEQIRILEGLTGVEINLDASDLEDATVLMEQFAEGVIVNVQLMQDGTTGLRAGAESTANAIVEMWRASAAAGDPQAFIDLLNTIRDDMDLTTEEAIFLGRAIESAFDEAFEDTDIDFRSLWEGLMEGGSFADFIDPEVLIAELADAGIVIPVSVEEVDQIQHPIFTGGVEISFPTEFIESLEFARTKSEELGLSVTTVLQLGEEGLTTYQEFATGIAGAFESARTHVEGAFEDIRSGIESQNPLLDIYSGKIDQSFEKWQAGQQQFRADLESVTALREQLVGDKSIPQEFVEAFDRQPISKQAWLAGLGESQLQEALGELSATFDLIDEDTKERQLQSFEGIMAEAQTIISDKYLELEGDADLAGPAVADAFEQGFNNAAAGWVTTAEGWMSDLIGVINQPIPGPTVGGITFSGGTFGGAGSNTVVDNRTTVINNPTTESPETSANRVNSINRLAE